MSEHETHVLPVKNYIAVFFALMVLVALFNFGFLNIVVMLGIAITKASLVVAIFMHLKYNAKILWVVAIGAFICLFIMLSLTLSDLMSRDWLPNLPETWL